ncbi:MAG: LysR family transcriptional regulator, partial [Rhizobium sp.]|nr:LysR family transcriptional regulator [Rhizobium sp.]
ARRGGFAAAAAELGMSPSAVSHAVRVIESRLGTPLFARTTRSVALTETGQQLKDSVASSFSEIGEAIEKLKSSAGSVTGLLRLNVPRTALSTVVTPVVAELSRRHPDLVVEIASEDASVDIVSKGFDAGIRLGEMIAQDMMAMRLTPPFRMIMVASPDYLAVRGMPQTIADLRSHNCIGFRQITAGGLYDWELLEDGKDVAVAVHGTVVVTDATYAMELALAGVGIAYLMAPLAVTNLASGRLVQILASSAIEEPGLFLYYPRRASLAPKLRAFITIAREVLKPSAK